MFMTSHEIDTEIALHLYKHQGIVVGDPVFVEESWYHTDFSVRFLAGAFFTTQLNLILSVTSKQNDSGGIQFMTGSFNCDRVLQTVFQMILNNFPDSGFRQKRQILADYGNMLASLMHRINQSSSLNDSNVDTLNIITRINSYEQLTDVEYIEDIMFKYRSKHICEH